MATNATPGAEAAFVKRRIARSSALPCAFRGVMAQPRMMGERCARGTCITVGVALEGSKRHPGGTLGIVVEARARKLGEVDDDDLGLVAGVIFMVRMVTPLE